MAQTTLNMLIQMRRDEVFNKSFILKAGEPGFEISTNTLKIGDGVKTWEQLDFANKELVDALISPISESLAEGGATALAIKEAKDAVTDLEKYVGQFPDTTLSDGTKVETVVGYINAKTAGIATDANLQLIEERVTAIEEAPYATQGYVGNQLTEFDTVTIQPIRDSITNITKEDGLLDQLEAAYIAADTVVAEAAASDATAKANAAQAAAEATASADATTKANAAEANAKAYVDEEDKFDIDMKTISSLGGIGADVDLNGMTTHDILKKLLYPYVDAVVGSATASPNGGTYEKGETKTITQVSISVTKKSEPITSVALYNGSDLLETKTDVANGGTITFTGLSIPVTSNGGKLTVKVTYPDATGAAKTVSKETGGFSFISPYFYGVCGAADEINADLVLGLTKDLSAKGTKTYNYTTDSQRMVIAYPSSYGKIKLVKDGNGLDNTGAFGEPTTVSVTSDKNVTESYYVYANGVTSGSAKMTFSY